MLPARGALQRRGGRRALPRADAAGEAPRSWRRGARRLRAARPAFRAARRAGRRARASARAGAPTRLAQWTGAFNPRRARREPDFLGLYEAALVRRRVRRPASQCDSGRDAPSRAGAATRGARSDAGGDARGSPSALPPPPTGRSFAATRRSPASRPDALPRQLALALDLRGAARASSRRRRSPAARVYVGSLDGQLHAIDLATGEVALALRGRRPRSSPRRRCATASSTSATRRGPSTPSTPRPARGAGRFETAGADRLVGATSPSRRAIASSSAPTTTSSTPSTRESGSLAWKVETESYVHGTPAIAGRRRLRRRLRRLPARWCAPATARSWARSSSAATPRPSPAIAGGRAFVGTFENEVARRSTSTPVAVAWRFEHPAREFPFYASPAVTSGAGRRRRARQARARARRRDRQGALELHDRGRAIDCLAGHRRRPRGRRLAPAATCYALDLATGEQLWHYDAGAPRVAASPAVGGGIARDRRPPTARFSLSASPSDRGGTH